MGKTPIAVLLATKTPDELWQIANSVFQGAKSSQDKMKAVQLWKTASEQVQTME